MTKRKRYSADFKAKAALEAICEEMTLSELSKKYNVHPNMISAWKRTAIETMVAGFSKGKETEQQGNDAEIARLHAKIGQLVVERDFLSQTSGECPVFCIDPAKICSCYS